MTQTRDSWLRDKFNNENRHNPSNISGHKRSTLPSMARYYVYILELGDMSYYVGITNNLRRRLAEHESKYNPDSYTAFRLPVKLCYFEVFRNPLDAIAFEKKLKGWSRQKKQAYIARNWQELKKLAACRNPTRFDRPASLRLRSG